jgi:transcriptional regulator with XRE-family HTH domain
MSKHASDLGCAFGANLVSARRWAGLSQEELALRAALHRTEIGLLERGLRLAKADTVLKLSGSLSVESSDLFKGMVWVPREKRATGSFMVHSVAGWREVR